MKKTRLWLLFVLLISGGWVHAQFSASGTISDDEGNPLVGVTVTIKGTTIGTISDIDGKYKIDVPTSSATLEFSYLGYTSATYVVTSGASMINVSLSEDVTRMEEVVVTGLASSVKRSNLANSVASVPASEISGITVPTTTEAALYGKFKGVNISSNSGAPGGGMSFKLRGTTSINGSSQPLFIIDGIYLDNSSIKAGLNVVSKAQAGGATTNQDNPSNRLADIDPNDIEKIEVLKGASAAAIYGSRASGGVVIITTKRGTSGKTSVRLSQSVGVNTILNPQGVRQWTEERVLGSNFASKIDLYRQSVANGQIHDYEDELFGNNGKLYNSRISVSGGNDQTQFFIGGTYKNEEGIVKNTGIVKESARLNLNHKFNDWLDGSVSTNYIHSSADRGFFNNDNTGTTMGVALTSTPSFAQLLPDANGNFPKNDFAASNFLETAAKITNNEEVNRFIGGGSLTAKIFSTGHHELKLLLNGGADYYNLNTTAIFPNSLQFERDGNGLNGVSAQGSTKNLNSNLSAFLVYSHYANSGISSRTQLGVTQENFENNFILGTASNLVGSQTNLDQSGTRDIEQTRLIQHDKGFFGQEELNYKDKVIATVGVRGDKSSNNGDVNKFYFYPKASVAVNLHEFMDMNSDNLNQIKLRAAYGQSGNFAKFGSKFTTFTSGIIDGQPGVEIDNLLGNANVAPERQKELEFGVDIGALKNRMLFDFTYYIKNVEDLLLEANVPWSTGFITRVTNAASLQNKGVEIGLDYQVIRTTDFNWNTRIGWWKNKAEVTKLLVPSYTTGGFADFLGQFRIKEGHSPTEIIGVGNNPDADGYVVYGDAEPDFQMSWFNTLTWKNFDLTFLWHWKKGGQAINLSTLLFDLGGTTHDYDDVDLDPNHVIGNGPYRVSQIGVNSDVMIEDASYIRLREIGLYYTLPKTFVKDVNLKLGFSGTNLINIFKYNSYDPEVSNFGSDGLSTQVEVNPFPSSKRFDFHIIADF
ncbi:MAG: SusC/RagA family TonB-linked outer membrane protein [Saprospiraceae bacterium]|uniref:SusC/RagA family TonB-linked outer membrane protein n=1 Tax=Candidatus Opimibacter skivensis TaxID=2982028 RepID=A0A9D7SWI4_9BACT|nr:SusC/RagA family TonB-linked outer membrane protein [Candidatus Opimibacter skivensis]